MTEAEVDSIIESLIIDNNTMQINPSKMRQVLKAINSRIPGPVDPSTVDYTEPLAYDSFSNTVSMSQASTSTDGYLTKDMFSRIKVVPFSQMHIFGGPEKPPGSITLEVDDVAAFLYRVDDTYYFFIGAYKGGEPSDIDNSWTLIMNSPYKE